MTKTFAIYDRYVEQMLWHFKKFANFARKDLCNYAKFKKALNGFCEFYALKCDLNQLDRYLWLAGKRS